jgi:hypothetical protein
LELGEDLLSGAGRGLGVGDEEVDERGSGGEASRRMLLAQADDVPGAALEPSGGDEQGLVASEQGAEGGAQAHRVGEEGDDGVSEASLRGEVAGLDLLDERGDERALVVSEQLGGLGGGARRGEDERVGGGRAVRERLWVVVRGEEEERGEGEELGVEGLGSEAEGT